jgi:drug/metabolite transporter (DMT)-like permease
MRVAVLSLVAALIFGLGVALQQHEARTVAAADALSPTVLLRLVGRPLWVVGLAADIGGWLFQAAALAHGSLIVVQPLITTNLVFALALSAWFAGQSVRAWQWLAVIATLTGLCVFLGVANPTAHSEAVASDGDWLLLAASVGGLVAIMIVLGRGSLGTRRAVYLGIGAGAAEAAMAVLSKAFADELDHGVGATFRSWEPYALVVVGILTLTVVQSSYQVGRPTVTLPVNTVTEPMVAASIGGALFSEQLHIGGWRAPVVVGSLAVMAVGLVTLARSSALAGEVPDGPDGPEGTGPEAAPDATPAAAPGASAAPSPAAASAPAPVPAPAPGPGKELHSS